MKPITIDVQISDDPFARINKALLDDKDLSWKAKGVLCYLLGKPKDWTSQVTDIANHGTDGEGAIRSAMKELRKLGYAQLQVFRKNGRFVRNVFAVADRRKFQPNDKQAVSVQIPDTGLPDRGFPDPDNGHLSKKDGTENEVTKKEGVATATRPWPNGDPPVVLRNGEAHADFIQRWVDAFKLQFGEPYRFGAGKDGKAVKDLLTTGRSGEQLIEIARGAWQRLNEFPMDSALTICGFNSRLTEIAVKLKMAPRGKPPAKVPVHQYVP